MGTKCYRTTCQLTIGDGKYGTKIPAQIRYNADIHIG